MYYRGVFRLDSRWHDIRSYESAAAAGDRAVLEARQRAATTEQRQLLRIRIVLEAAEGHGTREIARELETTPTTVSLWRIRYAREGLDGLEDRLRSGAPSIYGEATDQRIRKVLDEPPPKGFALERPLIARALGYVDVQYVWRSLRKQKIDLAEGLRRNRGEKYRLIIGRRLISAQPDANRDEL